MIDFTASNGRPENPSSLHYTATGCNDYMKIILEIGTLLEHYTLDKEILMFGFGAKWKDHGHRDVNFSFPLTGSILDPRAASLKKAIKVYKESLDHCELLGPTNGTPALQKIIQMVKGKKNKETGKWSDYFVINILLDGDFDDTKEFLQLLYQANSIPLSVNIIGVGEHDFTSR